MKYYSREWIITRGNEYYSREPNITRGDQILLAGTIYYSRKRNITRGNVLITRGTEKLLAGTKYYSREYNITRGNELLLAGKILLAGKNYYSRESIYYSRERYITRGREILAVYGTRGLPYTTVLAASIKILCDNTCAQKPSKSLLINKSKTKQKYGIIYIYTSYLARTQKIEEIVTINTLMKPIFNWGRLLARSSWPLEE